MANLFLLFVWWRRAGGDLCGKLRLFSQSMASRVNWLAQMCLREVDEGDVLLRCVQLFEFVQIHTFPTPLEPIYVSSTHSGDDCAGCNLARITSSEVGRSVAVLWLSQQQSALNHVRSLPLSSPRLLRGA